MTAFQVANDIATRYAEPPATGVPATVDSVGEEGATDLRSRKLLTKATISVAAPPNPRQQATDLGTGAIERISKMLPAESTAIFILVVAIGAAVPLAAASLGLPFAMEPLEDDQTPSLSPWWLWSALGTAVAASVATAVWITRRKLQTPEWMKSPGLSAPALEKRRRFFIERRWGTAKLSIAAVLWAGSIPVAPLTTEVNFLFALIAAVFTIIIGILDKPKG